MKKLFAVICTLVLVFTLCSCKSVNDDISGNSSVINPTSTTTDDVISSDNTTTKFIAWKQMTINAYNKGETYKGVPVYTITKITHHNNTQTNSVPTNSAVQTKGSYVIADSATRALTNADLQGMTAYQLRLARNEIYARHGRTFKDAALQNYFNSCSWYKPDSNYNNANDDANLSAIEKQNINTIRNYENSIN